MKKDLMQQAITLASREYSVYLLEEQVEEQTLYLAKNLELYGCMAEGNTPEEARQNLKDARIDYIYSLLEDGLEVPEPAQSITTTTSTLEATQVQFNLKTIYVAGHLATTKPLNDKAVEVHMKISTTV